jgi:hypothetical protein
MRLKFEYQPRQTSSKEVIAGDLDEKGMLPGQIEHKGGFFIALGQRCTGKGLALKGTGFLFWHQSQAYLGENVPKLRGLEITLMTEIIEASP